MHIPRFQALSSVRLLTAACLVMASAAHAQKPAAVITAEGAPAAGSEAAAAREFGARLAALTALAPGDGGVLRDAEGRPAALDQYAAVWIHEGDDSAALQRFTQPPLRDALRRYVEGGGGLLLTGAAGALVEALGAETVRLRTGGPGRDAVTAEIIPVLRGHPLFEGVALREDRIPVSDAGYPAFADWHGAGGPRAGMLLARTPGGRENPVAEFAPGNGRILVLGWRLAHYAHTANAHRANLERLTANALGYLGDRTRWVEVVPDDPAVDPARIADAEWTALRLAVEDLTATFAGRYPDGPRYRRQLDEAQARYRTGGAARAAAAEAFRALRRDALLANPLIDFDEVLVVRRGADRLGLPKNWQSNSSLPKTGYDNEIAAVSLADPAAPPRTIYRPENGAFAGDVDLHFDAGRLLFSMPAPSGAWRVYELRIGDGTPAPLALIDDPGVDNYDACYLPDGNILFCSTAPFTGVPCVRGSDHVCNLYLLDRGDGAIRRLTFDQDHNWCPTVLNDGRVLYLRWEYSDIPHYVSRILFQMNPDGTGQMAYYGRNSYWPNALFFARPVPGHPTRFVGIVGGHHDVPRMGELVLFDTARGRREADGVVQRIPGRGKPVDPVILDGLVGASWPKFLHPWPLSDKYFLVAAQPSADEGWGLYLADAFDNMVLVKSVPGAALLEPIPLKSRSVPPVIPAKVDPARKDALVYLADVYGGGGLKGVPRGTVKALRLFTYHFSYHGMGGQVDRVGLDGPWDIKRILGTVPVEPDGSALFTIPANTPVSLQPLDGDGKALQLMRSWLTAMPGETISCAGCHEETDRVPPAQPSLALAREPSPIAPWYGPARGFSFVREVQPVLDAHCVRCHDGTGGALKAPPDLAARPPINPPGSADNNYKKSALFTPAYLALRRYVRPPTIESDMHMLAPADFHADTSALVQLLRKGHYGVELDAEGWDRIITWIDLHAPAHGTWGDIVGPDRLKDYPARRRELLNRYAGIDEDPEAVFPVSYAASAPARPLPAAGGVAPAVRPTEATPPPAPKRLARRTVDLGGGLTLTLFRVPAGAFTRGSADGFPDERPPADVRIERPFWLGAYEITNGQFARFDPAHDSRLEHGDFLQFSVKERGFPLNAPDQPVVRVSRDRALAFCRWLSARTGETFTLPTEDQWEYACRAGTRTDWWYGSRGEDFAACENLADRRLFQIGTYAPWALPSGAVPPWRLAVEDVDDGHRVSAPVGSYRPNPWGLYDMNGNVAEWTGSAYAPYGAPAPANARAVVRGGSWYTRPERARAAYRTAYYPWQGVFDVGFRVAVEEVDGERGVASAGAPAPAPAP